MDDPSGDTKSMDDIMFDKVNNVSCFNLASGMTSLHFEK